VVVAGNQIHVQANAEHATRFTYLQQVPGSNAFEVILADTTQTSLTLFAQAPGQHVLKAFGINPSGPGPESEVVVVTIAASAAA